MLKINKLMVSAVLVVPVLSAAATHNYSYTYDDLGRLKKVDKTNETRTEYEYDLADNRLSKTITSLDTTKPSAPGVPAFSSITQYAATASWSAATDNVGVTGYEYSLNGGSSWSSTGSTSVGLSGLSIDTSYTLLVRAKDNAGNRGNNSSATFATLPPSISISNISITKTSSGQASYELSAGVSLASQNSVYSAGKWITPQIGMNKYEAMATPVSSASLCANSGTLNAWINLGAGAKWTHTNYYPSVIMNCSLKIEIRKASNPSVILSTATVSLTGKY